MRDMPAPRQLLQRPGAAALAFATLWAGCAELDPAQTLARRSDAYNAGLPTVSLQQPFDNAGLTAPLADLVVQLDPGANLTPTAQARVEISWGTNPDLLGAGQSVLAPIDPGSQARATLWGLQPGQTYYWKARVLDPGVTPPDGAPSDPRSFTVMQGKKQLSWHQTQTAQFSNGSEPSDVSLDRPRDAVALAFSQPAYVSTFSTDSELLADWTLTLDGGTFLTQSTGAATGVLTLVQVRADAVLRVDSIPSVVQLPAAGTVTVDVASPLSGPALWLTTGPLSAQQPLAAIGFFDGGVAFRDGALWRQTGARVPGDGGSVELGLRYDNAARSYDALVNGAPRGSAAFLSNGGTPAQVTFGLSGGAAPAPAGRQPGSATWSSLRVLKPALSGALNGSSIDIGEVKAVGARYGTLEWSEDEADAGTVRVQVQVDTGTQTWQHVSDLLIPGNSAGLPDSPVSLAQVDPALLPRLRLVALLDGSGGGGPRLRDWTVVFSGSELVAPLQWQAADAGATVTLAASVVNDLYLGIPGVDVSFSRLVDAGVEVPLGVQRSDASGKLQQQVTTAPARAVNTFIARAPVVKNPVVRFDVDTRLQAIGPPRITSVPPTVAFCDQPWTYQPAATAKVTWSAPGAPAGMTLDSGSGLLEWTPPAGLTGLVSFTLTATSQDGAGSQPLFLTVSCAPDAETPPEEFSLRTTCGCTAANPLLAVAALLVLRTLARRRRS